MNAHCPTCRVTVIPTSAHRCPWCDHTFDLPPTTSVPPTDPRIELPGLMASRILPLTITTRTNR